MKIKSYVGLFFILITLPLNHVDKLFPNFTEIILFGNNFKIVEGFVSSDIIWTAVQKINLVFLSFGVLLLFPFSKLDDILLKRSIIVIFLISIIANSLLAVSAIHDYVDGFGDGLFKITSILLISLIVSMFFILMKINTIIRDRNNELIRLRLEVIERIEALKKKDLKISQITSKVDSIQDTNIFITKKIEALECLPLFIKETDNMETWSKLAHRRAMMIYGQLDKQLKDLEEAKTIAV